MAGSKSLSLSGGKRRVRWFNIYDLRDNIPFLSSTRHHFFKHNNLNTTSIPNSTMSFHWIPPTGKTLKINVHATSTFLPKFSSNDSGIGAIYRDSEGTMHLLTVGTIPFLTPLGNQLWAMYVPLLRAFEEGFRDVTLETDNLEAFNILKHFEQGVPAPVYDLVSQIDIRVKNKAWKCKVAFVYPARNKVARFLARLGLEAADRLYTFDRPVGGVEELLNWDMGLGIDHPDFQDIYLATEARDPVDFNRVSTLSDQIKYLGMGQLGAPDKVNLDTVLNADVLQEGTNIKEDFFHGGVVYHEGNAAFVGDAMLEDID